MLTPGWAGGLCPLFYLLSSVWHRGIAIVSGGGRVPARSEFGISSKTSCFTAIKFIMLSMNFLYRLLVLELCRRRRIFSGYVLAKASEK